MINLLQDTRMISFGNALASEIKRETIVVVMYNKISKLYLCQYWEEYNGLTCLLSGGVESDESSDQAVTREIAEETGYTDFNIIGLLGGVVESHYTKASGENFVKIIVPYLVILNSDYQGQSNKEEDEKFDNLFKSPQEIATMMKTYEDKSGSMIADHKEILKRGVEYVDSYLS